MTNDSIPARKQLPSAHCWNLDPLYDSDSAWDDDFKKIDAALQNLLRWKGHLADSPESLLHALEDDDALSRLEDKLFTFAHLRHDEDTANSHNAARLGRIEAKGAEIGGQTAWLEPELLKIAPSLFERYRNHPLLAFYKRTLDETERERKHTLSESEERILSVSSDVFSAPDKAFSLLNDADLKFPKIKNESGKRVSLSHGNYRKFMESQNRTVRHDAFRATHNTFGSFRNTFASLLESSIKANVLSAKLRHYPDTMSAALSSANIPVTVYTTLVETVRKNLPSYHRYFAFRAKRLGLDKIEMWDIQNSVVPAASVKQYSWQDAVKLVTEACRPLGAEYASVLKRAFAERWIDIPECKGKRSGAYSSGCYDSFPYLLLNFNGTLDSVSTAAHELGHSMHTWFSNTNQQYHYADYHIFAAEIASTTNELLLHHYLMEKSDDPAFKAYLRNDLLDTMRATLFRQTMFAEFEADMYRHCEAGDVLTPDLLCEEYARLNADYHGPAVAETPEIQFEWARIPHFYYGFYVYQYATGISAAAALAKNILAGNTEPYLNFLKAGDSKDVIDIIRDAGVDFSTSAPVEAAIRLFDTALDDLDKSL